MLYFFNEETTGLYYDLFDRLLSILTRFNPDTAEANFEDIIDKIILLYPNTEDSLTRFIPSFTPLTHYQDKILNCLSEFKELNKDAFSKKEGPIPLHESDVTYIKEILSSSDLFSPDTPYFLISLPEDNRKDIGSEINDALSHHTWLSIENWMVISFLLREDVRDNGILVSTTYAHEISKYKITQKGLDLIRTKFFDYLHSLYKDSYFANNGCFTYKTLEAIGKQYTPIIVF